jgi:hypothetical protein
LSILLTLALSTIFGFALYVGLTRSPLFAGVPIFFYRGLILCALSAALVVALMALRRRRFDLSTIIAAGALSLSFNICFLVILPVTLDRSISVFMLAQIEQHQDEGLDHQKLARVFVEKYVGDMHQIDRRVSEQRMSGNIALIDGSVRLTEQGHRFLMLSQNLARLFGTDPRFVGLPSGDTLDIPASKTSAH